MNVDLFTTRTKEHNFLLGLYIYYFVDNLPPTKYLYLSRYPPFYCYICISKVLHRGAGKETPLLVDAEILNPQDTSL